MAFKLTVHAGGDNSHHSYSVKLFLSLRLIQNQGLFLSYQRLGILHSGAYNGGILLLVKKVCAVGQNHPLRSL